MPDKIVIKKLTAEDYLRNRFKVEFPTTLGSKLGLQIPLNEACSWMEEYAAAKSVETLTAYSFNKAGEAVRSAEQQAKSEMPNSTFVLTGLNNKEIFFNVVCKMSQTNQKEIRDLGAKTRFLRGFEQTGGEVYVGQFSMDL